MRAIPQANDALAAMHRKDIELGLDPLAIEPGITITPAGPPPPARPDIRQLMQLDRDFREESLLAERERLRDQAPADPEPAASPTPPPRRRHGWRSEQMSGDQP